MNVSVNPSHHLHQQLQRLANTDIYYELKAAFRQGGKLAPLTVLHLFWAAASVIHSIIGGGVGKLPPVYNAPCRDSPVHRVLQELSRSEREELNWDMMQHVVFALLHLYPASPCPPPPPFFNRITWKYFSHEFLKCVFWPLSTADLSQSLSTIKHSSGIMKRFLISAQWCCERFIFHTFIHWKSLLLRSVYCILCSLFHCGGGISACDSCSEVCTLWYQCAFMCVCGSYATNI